MTVSGSLIAGNSQYIVAKRTGSLEITFSWSPYKDNGTATASVTLSDIPGPLNSLMGILTSYSQQGPAHSQYSYAYAAPGIPTVNPNAGYNIGDTAAGSYWPLWTDTRFFPVPGGTGPDDLGRAR